jgi:PAS domain-containing protein
MNAPSAPRQRPSLRLVETDVSGPLEWTWFCGHCAAPSPRHEPPAPNARVCGECGLGLLLEARCDAAPGGGDAFLVVDSRLTIQAMSVEAEAFLGLPEELAVNRPVAELLAPADAEAQASAGLAATIARAASGEDTPHRASVRPHNTFGVRMRVRVAPCGPPRAALIVLEPGSPALQLVDDSGRR